jgi:NDP-sugar pyrophosphorylase family protein
LRSVYHDRPKVLVPINGVPFLRCCLEWLRGFGAQRVVLSLGYMADAVQEYVRSESWPGLEIVANVESAPLGTGGALRACLPLIQSETVLVANGDSFTRLDLCEFVQFHRSRSARLSMVLTHQPNITASGLVETDSADAVTSFTEKPRDQAGDGFINAGLYLLQREVVGEIAPDKPVSLEKDVFPGLCGRGCYALKGRYPFIDIGTPESYERAARFFAEAAP